MPTRANAFFFHDLIDEDAGGMVFELARPDEPTDLFVKLCQPFIITVATPPVQTGAARKATRRKVRGEMAATRTIEYNAVRLKDGLFVSIPHDALVHRIIGVADAEDCLCENCASDKHCSCSENEEVGAGIVAIGVEVDEG